MRRPVLAAAPLLALIAAVVFMAVVLGYLLTQPTAPAGRVVSVDADGNVTD